MTGRPVRRLLGGAVLTAAASGAVLYPFFAPYARVEHQLGASRGLGQAVYFSADLRDFLRSADLSLHYGWTGHALGVRPSEGLRYLWPGGVTLALALIPLLGSLVARRGGRPLTSSGRDVQHEAEHTASLGRRSYAVLGAVTALLCLGSILKVWGVRTGVLLPYLLLYPLRALLGCAIPHCRSGWATRQYGPSRRR